MNTTRNLRAAAAWAGAVALLLASVPVAAQQPVRARDLGVPFDGRPGPLNAITDVAGVEVGHVTLVAGDGPLVPGKGPVRTGVTAVLPQGRDFRDRLFAAWYTLNGNGEMTGTTWVEESGMLGSPILITNTHSVGIVRDAVVEWNARRGGEGYSGDFSLPVVAETWDGDLNDINGFHVTKAHALAAIESARGGPVTEGNVGGGTGMITHYFKGGIGTASRVVSIDDARYTVGALVQSNYGSRRQLQIAGVPVGREITDLWPSSRPPAESDVGSIIVVVATDAPLLPHQLKRIAKRVPLGIGAVGGRGGNSSGDIFLVFSTANRDVARTAGVAAVRMLANEEINPLFDAVAQATEESIVNALVAARTMTGANGHVVHALPHDRLREVLRKYNRLVEPAR